MPSISLENLTPFGRLAVKLDGDLSELVRLSGQLERLEIDSDSGLDRAMKLLEQFAKHGENISEGIQSFSKMLQDVREQSEMAVKRVADRAPVIQQRQQQRNQIQEKLIQVQQNIKSANDSVAGFRKEGKKEFSNEERDQIAAALERLHGVLDQFMADTQSIKEEASRMKFKGIEREAQSVLETLRSSQRKITKAITPQ